MVNLKGQEELGTGYRNLGVQTSERRAARASCPAESSPQILCILGVTSGSFPQPQ